MRHGSLCNEKTRLGPISVTTESSRSFFWRVWGWGLPAMCHVGFCDGGMIYKEEKKMLVKNEEC